jgi:hypothetical protein
LLLRRVLDPVNLQGLLAVATECSRVVELEATKFIVETCHKNDKNEYTVIQSIDGIADGRKFHVDNQMIKWKETDEALRERVGQQEMRGAEVEGKRARGVHEEQEAIDLEAEEEEEPQGHPKKRISPPRSRFGLPETDGFVHGVPNVSFDFDASKKFYPTFSP